MKNIIKADTSKESPQKGGAGLEFLIPVLDCLEGAVAICDVSGGLLYVNQTFSDLLCPPHADLKAFLREETIESLLAFQGGKTSQDDWLGLLLKDGSCEFKYQLCADNGNLKLYLMVNIQLVEVAGETIGVVSMRDITQRKRLEFELATAKISIEELTSEVQSEFLANMSHELRTPMHSILSCARLGIRKVESAPREKLKSYLEMITSSGDQLMVLLSDLLALSTPESYRAAYTLRDRNLVEDINSVVLEFRGLMEESDISIIYDPPAFTAMARYDVTKIYQVLRNLLSNALKFTAPSKMIRLRLEQGGIGSAELQRAAYKVSVIDQGMGVDTEDLQRVFKKFTQGRKVKTGVGGVGLGLSICKRIIEDHEGHIWAEQNEDKGTTVSFLLPAIK